MNRFGACFHAYGVSQYCKLEHLPTVTRFVNDLNLGIVRFDVNWDKIETSKGVYDWTLTDGAVDSMPESTDILFIVFCNASWAIKDRWLNGALITSMSPPTTPKNMPDYREFITNLVRRYKGRVKYYQIENEVYGLYYSYGWYDSPQSFLDLFQTASQAIRIEDPEAKILCPGIAFGDTDFSLPIETIKGQMTTTFIKHMLIDMEPYYDIVDLHIYYSIESIPSRIKWIKKRICGTNKKIWATEVGGVDSRTGQNPNDLTLQANDLVKRFVLLYGLGVERAFWLLVHKDKDVQHPLYGPMRLTNDPYALDKRPAYFAFKNIISKIGGFKHVFKINNGYKFIVNGKSVFARFDHNRNVYFE